MDDTQPHKTPQGSKDSPKKKVSKSAKIASNYTALKARRLAKYTPKDLAILKNYDSNLTDYANLKKLEDEGKVNLQHAYKRLKRSDYLRQDIEQIKEAHRQFLIREAVPKASKAIMEVLNAKKPKKVIGLDGTEVISDGLTPLQKMPAVKLVYDKYYSQDQPQGQGNTFINILSQYCTIETYGKSKAKVGEEGDK